MERGLPDGKWQMAKGSWLRAKGELEMVEGRGLSFVRLQQPNDKAANGKWRLGLSRETCQNQHTSTGNEETAVVPLRALAEKFFYAKTRRASAVKAAVGCRSPKISVFVCVILG
jgi:hypothetical protein